MDAEIKQFLNLIARSRGIQELESTLPLEETSLLHIKWSQNWRNQLEKHLKSLYSRCDLPSKKLVMTTCVDRINFELSLRGQKKLKL